MITHWSDSGVNNNFIFLYYALFVISGGSPITVYNSKVKYKNINHIYYASASSYCFRSGQRISSTDTRTNPFSCRYIGYHLWPYQKQLIYGAKEKGRGLKEDIKILESQWTSYISLGKWKPLHFIGTLFWIAYV